MSEYPQPLPKPVRVVCELCGFGVVPSWIVHWMRESSILRVCRGCAAALDGAIARVVEKRKDSRKGEEQT